MRAGDTAAAPIDTDALPPTWYLILEVLAARWRLGEDHWTFPTRMLPALRKLAARDLIWWQYATVPRLAFAGLTPAGRDAVLLDTYTPPAEKIGNLALGGAPATWAGWTWPDWVPARVREQVEGFWAGEYGRGPERWLNDISQQGAPPFGATVTLADGHAWNSIGRLILPDGRVVCTQFHPASAPREQQKTPR
jgi:hypothetical protein